jgi:hypothetical protein
MDCVMHEDHGGQHMSEANPDDFLANVIALPTDIPFTDPDAPPHPSMDNQELEAETGLSRERSERLLRSYRRVLDNVFEDLGGKMNPALRVIQFDFHGGCLDLPDSCLDWWNGWLSEWRARGLQVQGCGRVPL